MSRATIRVFEHETITPGEKSKSGDVVPKDLDLGALARFNDRSEKRYFQLGYRNVKFSQYVGYLQVGRVAFEILPKADRGVDQESALRWKKALLAMLQVALGVDLYRPSDASQDVKRSTILDVLVACFVEEVGRILREGLARAYQTQESNGSAFRGRLVIAEHLRQNLVRPDRFFVRFASFSRDITVNRLVAQALHVASTLPVSNGLRALCLEQLAAFGETTPVKATPALFARLRLGRSTARYEKALLFARMILEQTAPTLSGGESEVFALLFDMNVLWEAFVAALFRRACPPGLRVQTQVQRVFWRVDKRQRKLLRPDIVVAHADKSRAPLLIVDTKWKVNDGSPPDDADLKQMFAYNELFECSDALLLCPARGSDRVVMKGTFAVTKGHVCRTGSLGLFDHGELRMPSLHREVSGLIETALAL